MKRYHLILPFIIFAMMSAQAQTFQSQQILQTSAQYKGTVYEPFDDTPPSEQYSEGISSSPNRAPGKGGVRNGFGPRPDDKPADTSPVGEPWVLAAFAFLFAGVVALRKRKNTTL